MIKVIVNDIELDLKSDTVVALSKKAADIGSLQNRFSSFTNKFTVPRTKKNRDALGVRQINDFSLQQYKEQVGKIVSGGIEIATNVVVIIESVGQEITLSIRAGNGTLFDRLNKTKLSDLDFSDVNHIWETSEVLAAIAHDWTDVYTYPIFQSGAQSNGQITALSYGLIPFVFCKALFARIGEFFGYDWNGDTYDLDQFERLSMPIATLNNGSVANNTLKITMTAVPYSFNPTTETEFYPNFNVNVDQWGLAFDTGNTNELAGISKIYFVPLPGQYTIEFDYDVTVYNNEPITPATLFTYIHIVVMQRSDEGFVELARNTTVLNPVTVMTSVNFNGTATLDFSLEKIFDKVSIWSLPGDQNTGQGAYAYVYFENDAGAYTIDVDLNAGMFKVASVKVAQTHANRPVSLGDHLPDWTLGKFIKEVGNIFGAIYDVNEYTKEIEITRLDEIATNKARAYDWSDKLDVSIPAEVVYILDGVGKVTSLKWKDDVNFSKEITIENEQLPDTAAYFQSDAVATNSEIALSQPKPLLFYNIWDADNIRIKTDGQARFAMIRNDNTTIYIAGLKTLPTLAQPHTAAYFSYNGSPHSLAWTSLYSLYFQPSFEPMTDWIQKVTAYFKLTDLDIQSFKFKYPVFISHFNRYFYVDEISEYTGSEQSTKVVLIGI